MYWLVTMLASGISLALSFLNIGLGGLAFVALVPLFYRIRFSGWGGIYAHMLVAGITAIAVANYWIYLFLQHLTGSIPLAALLSAIYFFYVGHCIVFLFLCLRAMRLCLPLPWFAIVAPAFSALFLRAYPMLFEFNLAQTQVHFPQMLAPVTHLGATALNAFVVFINLVIAECVAKDKEPVREKSWPVASAANLLPAVERRWYGIALLALATWLFCGWVSETLRSPSGADTTNVKVGIIQTDDAPGRHQTEPTPGYTLAYSKELRQAYALAKQGAEFIVWPESRPKGLLTHEWVRESHLAHARRMNADLLMHDLARTDFGNRHVNASVLYTRTGLAAQYHKIKPIPFGEAIPRALDFAPIRPHFETLFRNIYKPIVPGREAAIFPVAGLQILPLICYEILDRQHLLAVIEKNPQVDLVVLQSNDRWFFSRQQVTMHNAVAQLRAAEIARPILHIVNGGPSFLIDARGVIIATTDYGRAGAYLLDAPIAVKQRDKHAD